MQYGSTYAMGTPGAGGAVMMPRGADPEPLPTPKPAKLHWSTMVFAGGMAVCFVALLATVAGVPASMGYDKDAPGAPVETNSHDPLTITRAMDSNMRYMAELSNDDPKHYVGRIESINRSEAAIPVMAAGLADMSSSVKLIDAKLKEVFATSSVMGEDMTAMTEQSTASADTMALLESETDELATSMSDMRAAAEILVTNMDSIQKQADDIAANGTAKALKATTEMNATMPEGVPEPATEPLGSARR